MNKSKYIAVPIVFSYVNYGSERAIDRYHYEVVLNKRVGQIRVLH